VLTSGHLVDLPSRPAPRFPATLEQAVAARIRELFAGWSIGAADLVLSGGARGADILFAECGLDRGARVRLLLALPPAEFVERSVALPGGGWEARFERLLRRCQVEVLPERLRRHGQRPFELVNAWMLDEALRLCPPGRLRAALVWDEQAGSGGGTASMAALLRERGVPAAVINPRTVGA